MRNIVKGDHRIVEKIIIERGDSIQNQQHISHIDDVHRGGAIADEEVYLMIKVRTPFELVDEFNEFWGKESLPI